MTKYYIRKIPRGFETFDEEYWRVDDGEVYQIGIVSSSGMSRFPRQEGDSLDDMLNKIAPGGMWYKLDNSPGVYFPRMARPTGIKEPSPGRCPDQSDGFQYSRARSTGQLHAFIEELDQICRVIHPEADNLTNYGHATRNLLMLACTDVEAHWKMILQANCYRSTRQTSRFDTNDYVKLLSAMRLDQYAVNLNYYPWLDPIIPFADWSIQNPTASLGWYHAYNQVKHDREANFAQATLERAFAAVTACFVMLCAQYGLDFALQGKEAERAFFQLLKAPTWAPSEVYVPPYGAEYERTSYEFR